MASKKAEHNPAQGLDDSDVGLDRAIDELRGVLKRNDDGGPAADDTGTIGGDEMNAGTKKATSLDDDFGADFPAAADQPFGGDFGGSDFSGSEPFAAGAADEADPLGSIFAATVSESDDLPIEPGPMKPANAKALQDAIGTRIPETVAATKVRADGIPANFDLIMDIPIEMQIILGKTRLPVSGLMNLAEGALIGLDRKIGEPVEIMVNGRVFGRGEITVLEGDDTRFGVKLIEVIGSKSK